MILFMLVHFREAKISMPLFFFVTGWGGDFQESTPAQLNTMNLLSFRAKRSSLICSKPLGIGRWQRNSMRLLGVFFVMLTPLVAAFRMKLSSSKLRSSLSSPDTFSQGSVLLLKGFVGSVGSLSPTAKASSNCGTNQLFRWGGSDGMATERQHR